jgi:hypothetical protein
MVKQFVLEESEDYRFIRVWERVLYTNYFPVTALGLPCSRLWAKDRNVTQGDDADGGRTLLWKSHQILKFAPIVSPVDDSVDIEIVSYMMANEMALKIGRDIARSARFRS